MTGLITQSIFENYKELLLFFQQMSNYSSCVFVVSSCTLPFHVFAANINIFSQIGLFDWKFYVYPGSNLCHFFWFSLYLWRYVSLCYSSLTSTLKSKISILRLDNQIPSFTYFHFFLIYYIPLISFSHTCLRKKKHTHQQQRQQKNSADSTSNATLANKTLKTKCHSQTAGCFIITNLLIPIIPRGIEHVLLFH